MAEIDAHGVAPTLDLAPSESSASSVEAVDLSRSVQPQQQLTPWSTVDSDASATSTVLEPVAQADADPAPLHRVETMDIYDPTPVIRRYLVDATDTTKHSQPEPASRSEHTATASTATIEAATTTTSSVLESADPTLSAVPSSPPLGPATEPPRAAVHISADPPPAATTSIAVDSSTTTPLASTPVQPLAVDTRIRDAWELMFGARYEDPPTPPNATQSIGRSPAKRSTLRRKLEHGRQLDERLRTKQSPLKAASKPVHQALGVVNKPTLKPGLWLALDERPFEDAGLSSTTVRFCVEHAIQATVLCLAQFHAIAQDEPAPLETDIRTGLYITQWELDTIVHNLVDASSDTTRCHPRLHNPEYAGLPLTTLLQVSWFVPLDDFSGLRVAVAQSMRQYLSERKLAVLNATLHRHFVLRPQPGVRMQRLLLKILDTLRPAVARLVRNQLADDDKSESSTGSELVVELLRALHVDTSRLSIDHLSLVEFLRLTPMELLAHLELTSVLVLQRVVYFRFLIEALAKEKNTHCKQWWTPARSAAPSTRARRERNASTTESATPRRSTAKQRRRRKPPAPPQLSPQPQDASSISADSSHPEQSNQASHGSLRIQEAPPGIDPPDDQHEAATLHLELATALNALIRTRPWLVDEEPSTLTPERESIQAIYLAAEACQQSLGVLLSTHTNIPVDFQPKLHKVITKISALTAEDPPPIKHQQPTPPINHQQPTPRSNHQQPTPPSVLTSPSSKPIHSSAPPPPAIQRAPSEQFPPPYVATGPAYWSFTPDFPSPTVNASIPRSTAKANANANASPGVGNYDLQRSDRLTFQQRTGFTFNKSGLSETKEPTPTLKPPTSITRAESATSIAPPPYTHWVPSQIEGVGADRSGRSSDDDGQVDRQVRDALRLQHSYALDDIVQTLLHTDRPSSGVSDANNRPRPQSARHQQTTSRVVSRVRGAVTAREPTIRSTPTPTTAAQPRRLKPRPRHTTPTPTLLPKELQQPPKDHEPPADDAHLHWAARVKEFYHAKLKESSAPTNS